MQMIEEFHENNLDIDRLRSDASMTYEQYQKALNTEQNGYMEEQRKSILQAFKYEDTHQKPKDPYKTIREAHGMK